MENDDAARRFESLKNLTGIVYLLQLLGFVTGIAFVAGVIVDYVKRDEVRGTWLESHVEWQIKTFWISLGLAVLGVLTFLILIGYVILVADTIWVLYRIIKGGLKYLDGQPVS